MTEASVRALSAALLHTGDAERLEVPGATVTAAVLVPLFIREQRLHAVFTRRREELRQHGGQISFPGGRRDQQDRDLVHTALREAHEEIGLDPAAVEILGALQPTSIIATDFAVYPIVGLLGAHGPWQPSALEVAEILELPLDGLADGYRRQQLTTRSSIEFRTDCFVHDDQLIWGATARILQDLYERLTSVGL